MKGDTRKRYEEVRIILVDILCALRGKSGGCKRYKRTLREYTYFLFLFFFFLIRQFNLSPVTYACT